MISDSRGVNLIQKIESIMTPLSLINGDIAPDNPKKILPDVFSDFNSILDAREEIRHLRLLPVKHNSARAVYHSISKDVLAAEVHQQLGDRQIILAENAYPYFLPPDVIQNIVWVTDSVSHADTINFIASRVIQLQINPDELILFERPRTSSTPLVRGTFPAVRHVHFWYKR